MNGYQVCANGLKKAIDSGQQSAAEATPQLKTLDFLAECSQEEINALFVQHLADSSNFWHI